MSTLLRRCAFIILALVVYSSASVMAQDDKLNQFSFEDVPTEEAKPPYFAVAGGFIATAMFHNVDDLNGILSKLIPGASMTSPFLLTGAQAFAAIGIIPNVRLGFMSVGGGAFKEGTVGNFSRRVEYSMTMNGVSIDYAISPFRGFSILPGANIGWGNITFESSQSSGASQAFDPTFTFGSAKDNYHRYARAGHFFVQPNLNFEYAFALFSMVRISAGYSISSVGDWKVDNIAPISGVPSSFNATGFTAQIGLFVGLFNN